MRKVSTKQRAKNRELARIKRELYKSCVICGCNGSDLAHLLPKSLYPEYYIEEQNLVIMCRDCHNQYDNDLTFRKQHMHLYDKISKFDAPGAYKYFRMYE